MSSPISITDHQLPYDTHNTYDVVFHGTIIHTLVTHTPSFVDNWLFETLSVHSSSSSSSSSSPNLLVGLDVEWRPSFQRNVEHPASVLQLCVDRRCLIFQLLYCPQIPESLKAFLTNENHTFVGVGIDADVEKLVLDYGLSVKNLVDLRGLGDGEEYKNLGLKSFALGVLGKEVNKPKRVTMSRWDNQWLYTDQVLYACLDAFISFDIGRVLKANSPASLSSSSVVV